MRLLVETALSPVTNLLGHRSESVHMQPPITNRQSLNSSLPPVLRVRWSRVVFLHYRLAPEILQEHLPAGFELELYDGSAWLTLVALSMQRFRPCNLWPPWPWAFRLISEQRFLNVRTYVKHRRHSGAFFLFGWLSRPWRLPLPDQPGALPCAFARLAYAHRPETGALAGSVHARGGALEYKIACDPSPTFQGCAPGSLAEFALERYNGLYWHRGAGHIFQTRHDPWQAVSVHAEVKDDSLLRGRWDWLSQARLEAAHYAPGLENVYLSGACELRRFSRGQSHRAASVFYTMP
jgi:uncharacterized protein YqjF (DUF2071 family)